MMESREGTVERLTVDGARSRAMAVARERNSDWLSGSIYSEREKDRMARMGEALDAYRAAILDEQREAVRRLELKGAGLAEAVAFLRSCILSGEPLTNDDLTYLNEALTQWRTEAVAVREAVGYTRNEDDRA